MASEPTGRYAEIDRIFARTLPLVQTALLQEYRLSAREAADIEQSLLEWFRGFSRRPGSPPSAEALKRHLLSMTCQAGHVYCSGKVGGSPIVDERLQRALTLGPQQVAIEIEEQGNSVHQGRFNEDGDGRDGS
jgi:hypothetical protein